MPTPLSPHRITGPEITSESRRGTKDAFALSAAFSIVISLLVNLFAHPLMQIFVKASEMEVIAIGVQYLRLEGFVLSRHRMAVSAVRVLPRCQTRRDVGCSDRHFAWHACGAGIPFLRHGAWRCRNRIAIPIGWALADMTGLFFLRRAFRSQKPA